jgi:hypothetical protein
MKENELRLGNYINCDAYGSFRIVGITLFESDNSSIFKSLKYYPKMIGIKDAKPIPLTKV